MKKSVAIILLILGGIVAVFGVSVICMLLASELVWVDLMWVGWIIDITLILGMAFGGYRLSELFRRKYEMGAPRFFLCAYVPPMVGSGIYFVIILILDSAGYFSGFLGGLGESLTALAFVIASIVLAVVGGIWLACGVGSRKWPWP